MGAHDESQRHPAIIIDPTPLPSLPCTRSLNDPLLAFTTKQKPSTFPTLSCPSPGEKIVTNGAAGAAKQGTWCTSKHGAESSTLLMWPHRHAERYTCKGTGRQGRRRYNQGCRRPLLRSGAGVTQHAEDVPALASMLLPASCQRCAQDGGDQRRWQLNTRLALCACQARRGTACTGTLRRRQVRHQQRRLCWGERQHSGQCRAQTGAAGWEELPPGGGQGHAGRHNRHEFCPVRSCQHLQHWLYRLRQLAYLQQAVCNIATQPQQSQLHLRTGGRAEWGCICQKPER